MYSHGLCLVVNGHLEHFQLHWKAAQALSVKNQQQNKQQEKNMTLKKGRNVFFLLTFLPKVAQFVYHRILEILGLEKRIFTATLPLNKIFNFLSQPYQSTTTLWLTGI